ncbi:MAG: 50S ribosomal protein L21 [Planctomycetes bacterium]|nr:50S ribosomal protein L21 [Planctomycetota bacterium]MCD7898198.1 50S ribosomal protein L21 [Planctomycetaceae bacterium]
MATQAVIRTGGKQVIVSTGDVIDVELLASAEEGLDVTFDDVLMIVDGENSTVGTPKVEGATVTAKVLKEVKGEKTRAVFFRRRKDSMTTKGHRQRYHQVEITGINA